MALSKDGVPYELISKTIPAIENEVNQVLENMMVGFSIKLIIFLFQIKLLFVILV